MARIRSIHPSACTDEDVATMSMAARLVWAYLPCHADREGRLKDSVFTLKTAILPADNVDINGILDELAERRHIVRYQTTKGRFIQIRNFKRYQNPHKNELLSTIPEPVEKLTEALAKNPEVSGVTPEKDRTAPAVRSGPDPSPSPSPVLVPVSRAQWTAHEWLQRFGAAWTAKTGRFYGAGQSDAKACGELADTLAALPEAEALTAQASALAMFAEFLGDESPTVTKARHPFSFFVTRWNGLRVPADEKPAQASGRGGDPPRRKPRELELA